MEGKKRIKTVLSIVLSFLLTVFLGQKVFLSGTPLISPDAKNIAQDLPRYIGQIPAAFSTFLTSSKVSPNNNGGPTTAPAPTDLPGMPWAPTTKPAPTRYVPRPPPGQIVPTTIFVPTDVPEPTDIPYPTDIPFPTDPSQPTDIPEPTQPTGQGNATMADFGKCMTAKGMVMYSQPGCSACTAQKQTLGAAYQYIKDISCPSNPSACSSAGVRSTPSWTKNGTMAIPGATSLEHLASVSGCDLPP